jgi:hypothetical protein
VAADARIAGGRSAATNASDIYPGQAYCTPTAPLGTAANPAFRCFSKPTLEGVEADEGAGERGKGMVDVGLRL